MKSFDRLAVAFAVYGLMGASAGLGGPAHERIGIARAIDGDTIVMGGEKIRLRHIDAPELTQVCRLSDGRMLRVGLGARNALRRAIGEQPIRCAIVGYDRYQRAVGYCFNNEGVSVEAIVLRAGFAVLRTGIFAPALARVSQFAQRSRRGMFACERAPDGRIRFENEEGR